MKNCVMDVKGTTLTITVDLSKSQGKSKSGKSEVIGTSEGNVSIPGHPGGNMSSSEGDSESPGGSRRRSQRSSTR